MMLFAALTISISANAASYTVVAFCNTHESITVFANTDNLSIFKDPSEETYIAPYKRNPYANSNMCAPNMNWATCYEYCFSYEGTTYYFNLN